jgi:hypothetical protein
MSVVVTAGASLAGAFGGAFLSYWLNSRFNRDAKRRELTLSLFANWESLHGARIAAASTMRKPPSVAGQRLNFNDLHEHRNNEWIELSKVIHAIEALGSLRRYDALDDDLYRALFLDDVRFLHNLLMSSYLEDLPERYLQEIRAACE